jgi:hypothetical protein
MQQTGNDTASTIKETTAKLQRLLVEMTEKARETQKRLTKLEVKRDPTPAQEAEADRLTDEAETLEARIDVIDRALAVLLDFR